MDKKKGEGQTLAEELVVVRNQATKIEQDISSLERELDEFKKKKEEIAKKLLNKVGNNIRTRTWIVDNAVVVHVVHETGVTVYLAEEETK